MNLLNKKSLSVITEQTFFVDRKSTIPVKTGGLPSIQRHEGSQMKLNSSTYSSVSRKN